MVKISGWDADAWVEEGVKVSSADLEDHLIANYEAADEMLGCLVKPPKTQKKDEEAAGAGAGADDDDTN